MVFKCLKTTTTTTTKGFGDLSERVSYVLEASPSARPLQSSCVYYLSPQWWKAVLMSSVHSVHESLKQVCVACWMNFMCSQWHFPIINAQTPCYTGCCMCVRACLKDSELDLLLTSKFVVNHPFCYR